MIKFLERLLGKYRYVLSIFCLVVFVFTNPTWAVKPNQTSEENNYPELSYTPLPFKLSRDLFSAAQQQTEHVKENNLKRLSNSRVNAECKALKETFQYLGTFTQNNELTAVIRGQQLMTRKVKVGELLPNTGLTVKQIVDAHFTVEGVDSSMCLVSKISY